MLNHTGLYHWLTDLELMAMLFGAAIHDAEHTGTTNAFHVAIQSGLAKLYKDKSVLENHHLQVAYTLLKRSDCNILSKLDQEEWDYFRHLVVGKFSRLLNEIQVKRVQKWCSLPTWRSTFRS